MAWAEFQGGAGEPQIKVSRPTEVTWLPQMGHAHHARKHYSQEQALAWIIQIAKGLRYLHTSKPKVRCSLSSAGVRAVLAPGSCLWSAQPYRLHAWCRTWHHRAHSPTAASACGAGALSHCADLAQLLRTDVRT